MPTEYEIILRRCGHGEWLGLLVIDGIEKYRTGVHKSSPVAALTAVQYWMQINF